MRILDTKDITIDRIVKFPFQSRCDKEKLEKLGIGKEKIEEIEKIKKEKIEDIANSFEKSGLLNSIIVREYNGKYQLIAGDLRLKAFQLTGKKEISAKIVEANDFEARIISFVENYHRRDLLDIEKENDIYDLWIEGKELYFNNKKSSMSKWIGIPYDTLKNYLQAGEERHKENQKKEEERSNAIINATASDLKETRILEKIDSETRKELLKAKIEDNISQGELRPIVKAIKSASEKNAPKEVLADIVKLVSEKKLNPYYAEDFANTITQIPIEEQNQLVKNIKKEEKVDIYKVKNFVDTYISSPPDIQKKLIEKNIDIGEAKVVSKFRTKEAREQILEERKTITELKEKELEKHTNIRIKQEEEVQRYGDRKIGNITNIDIEKIINSDEQMDDNVIDNYREISSKIKKLFQASNVKNMHTDKNRKIIIEYIEQVYEHCYTILIELGEIKVVNMHPTNPASHTTMKSLQLTD